jgi:hypothetical protein
MSAGIRFAQHGRNRLRAALDLVAGETVMEHRLEGFRHFHRGCEVYKGEVAGLKPCAGIVRDGEVFSARDCQFNRTASRETVSVLLHTWSVPSAARVRSLRSCRKAGL